MEYDNKNIKEDAFQRKIFATGKNQEVMSITIPKWFAQLWKIEKGDQIKLRFVGFIKKAKEE